MSITKLKSFPHDEVYNVKQKEEERREVFVGSFRPHRGHCLFEFNPITGEIKKAETELLPISFFDAKKGIETKRLKVVKKEDCIYVSALNFKNAVKKLGFKVNIIKIKKD